MKYATFGPDGKLNGRYDSDIHSELPVGAKKITDELFNESISRTNGFLELRNGNVVWSTSPPPPRPTEAELFQLTIKQFDAAVEAHLQAEAVAAGYTNIERACMYAPVPNPFEAESRSFVQWVGNVWAYCYGELQKVQAGTRPMPTIEQIISELPQRIPPP